MRNSSSPNNVLPLVRPQKELVPSLNEILQIIFKTSSILNIYPRDSPVITPRSAAPMCIMTTSYGDQAHDPKK